MNLITAILPRKSRKARNNPLGHISAATPPSDDKVNSFVRLHSFVLFVYFVDKAFPR